MKYTPAIGNMLGEDRGSLPMRLELHWSYIGARLEKTGLRLEKDWSEIGERLERHWRNCLVFPKIPQLNTVKREL